MDKCKRPEECIDAQGCALMRDCAKAQEAVAWQVRRADGRIDGVPIQWEHCTKDFYAATLSTGRYAGYENGPRCEVRALYAAPVAPAAAAQPDWSTAAVRDVLAERARQVSAECWTPIHDDHHDLGQLASAASCYAVTHRWTRIDAPPPAWPGDWARAWWKPTTRRRDLVKAGALIIAEIERIDRGEASQEAA